jgi:hypothetical protein
MINWSQQRLSVCRKRSCVLCQPVYDFGLGPQYRPGPIFSVILLLYYSKFPGLFGHPLTD